MAAVVLAGMIWASGCGDGTTEPTPPPPDPLRPTTATVAPGTAQLTALGATVQLTAQVLDQNGQTMSGTPVSWTSSDTSVATVDASGLVTAAGNGTATITAAAGSVSGTAAVTVSQEVGAVTVTPAADTLVAFGDTVQLSAEAFDANGHWVEGAEFSWESDDDAVATVDASGLVTAAGNGTATITAAAGSVSGTAAVTVSQEVGAVTVTPAADTLVAFGDTVQLSAEAFDTNGHWVEGAEFSWESDDDAVATVDASGLVTAAGNGTATITAAAGSVSGTAAVTVSQEVGAVTVTPAADTLVAFGDTVQLSAEAFDANGHWVEGAEFSWESDDDAVATVDASGLVTAFHAGEAVVTATSSGVSGHADLTVVSPAPDLAFMGVSPRFATVALGDTVTFTFHIRNKGTVASGATTIRAMRSRNSTISTRDTELRSYSLSSVAPSRERAFELTISVDPKSAPGTIYIGMCVDPVPDESDARNNCSEGARLTIAGMSGVRGSADSGPSVRVRAVNPSPSSRSLRLRGNAG